MTLDSKKCDECLAEMKENSNEIHQGIMNSASDTLTKINDKVDLKLASLDDKSTIFFQNQEIKSDKMINMVKWWIGVSLTLTLALAGGFGLYALKIETLNNEKANRDEVPTMNEIRMLRDLGDEYNRSVFVRKPYVNADTTAYYYFKKNIYGEYSITRGSEATKN